MDVLLATWLHGVTNNVTPSATVFAKQRFEAVLCGSDGVSVFHCARDVCIAQTIGGPMQYALFVFYKPVPERSLRAILVAMDGWTEAA
jgi:hypothetical protein